jgi:hypothetical protein
VDNRAINRSMEMEMDRDESESGSGSGRARTAGAWEGRVWLRVLLQPRRQLKHRRAKSKRNQPQIMWYETG